MITVAEFLSKTTRFFERYEVYPADEPYAPPDACYLSPPEASRAYEKAELVRWEVAAERDGRGEPVLSIELYVR